MQEQARNYFKEVQPSGVSSFYFKVKGETEISDRHAACHARIRLNHPFHTNPEIEVFATNARGDTPQNKRYLDWVMSREHSPWRKMFTEDDFEILYNSAGVQVGVLFPDSFLKKNTFTQIMGFVTALRFSSEPAQRAHVWDFLVQEHGVHPVEALVISSFFVLGLNNRLQPVLINTNHHVFAGDARLDIKAIKNGDLVTTAKSIFGIIPKGETDIYSFYLKSLEPRNNAKTGRLNGSVFQFRDVEDVLKLWRSVYEESA